MTVLVTGATGYLGTRLVPALLAAGHQVRVLVRSPDKLTGRTWLDQVEVVEGDATEASHLSVALADIEIAYYLLHSMDGSGDFPARDRELAELFAETAATQGVSRIVYQGGLHPDHEELSDHLASRVEVGEILLAAPVPAIVLQAAVIIGTGSASFEMLRHLTRRLPVMVAPRWLDNRIQPIAVRDVLHYLVGAARLPGEVNRTFDIGGPDVLRYTELIHRFAAIDGLARRVILTVPVLTPRLAGHWIGLVTPVSAGLAKPLVDSLIHEVVCNEDDIQSLLPTAGGLLGVDDAIKAALDPAGQDDPAGVQPGDPDWAG